MKYNPETVKAICDNLELGLSKEDSAELADISKDTFYEWVNTKPDFSDAVKKAMLNRKRRNLAIITKASITRWQAAAWDLERRFPTEFALRARLEHTGPGGGPIRTETSVGISKMTTNQLEKLASKLDAVLRKT